jgi:hypothetical protein
MVIQPVWIWFSVWVLGLGFRVGGWVLGLVVGVGSGSGWCWVAAFLGFSGSVLVDLFRTISHCPWRDFISFSDGEKETEAKKTPSNR